MPSNCCAAAVRSATREPGNTEAVTVDAPIGVKEGPIGQEFEDERVAERRHRLSAFFRAGGQKSSAAVRRARDDASSAAGIEAAAKAARRPSPSIAAARTPEVPTSMPRARSRIADFPTAHERHHTLQRYCIGEGWLGALESMHDIATGAAR